jgi:hypothetical protein
MLCTWQGEIVQFRTLMSSVKTLAIQVPFSKKGCIVFVAQKMIPGEQMLKQSLRGKNDSVGEVGPFKFG